MALRCKNCGNRTFRLRRAAGGAEAECTECGRVIPNGVLRAATKQPIQGDSPEGDSPEEDEQA
jgi:uncharacterized Zn finger protein